jgi:hypothetical protein
MRVLLGLQPLATTAYLLRVLPREQTNNRGHGPLLQKSKGRSQEIANGHFVVPILFQPDTRFTAVHRSKSS